MNLSLYGHDHEWLMVDCGVTFRDADGTRRSGFDIQMPDPEFISARRDSLQGLLLTHAHEDHIGAVAHLWRQLECPIWATAFTAEMLKRKLLEHGLVDKVPVHIVSPGDVHDHGVFSVEWVANTHSIPDPCGLVIRTPAGSVFHTADWKLDDQPVVGHGYDRATYQRLGTEGITAMVCDSTCADRDGFSVPEGALYAGLLDVVSQASGRVIVACFGSNIARLQTLARVAEATGRHIGLLGRSLVTTANAARAVGLWQERETLVASEHLAYLPRDSLLLVATGSQGEPRTALVRLASDSFRELTLDAGDTVVFSARAIPGNEQAIEALIGKLKARDIHVVTPNDAGQPIHASGHPSAGELKRLYGWVQPQVLVPVHGEAVHLDAQAELARQAGITRRLVGRNGDLFTLAPAPGVRRSACPSGRLGVGPKGLQRIAKPASQPASTAG